MTVFCSDQRLDPDPSIMDLEKIIWIQAELNPRNGTNFRDIFTSTYGGFEARYYGTKIFIFAIMYSFY